ncbi:MAG TPA: Hint domain-containing protein [Pseudomonadota bacterium]|nr:Hint domain-containing protein [Pseudomonadota bacterium]
MSKPRLTKKSLLPLSLALLGATACHPFEGCLVAGTMISTPAGPLPIEKLQPGQQVFAYNEERRCITVRAVTQIFRHKDRRYGRLTLDGGRCLLLTDSHPIYLANRAAYVAAGEVAAGDEALVWEESPAAAPRLSRVRVLHAFVAGSELATVFDITVEGEHNYFADGVLVHNKSPILGDLSLEVHRKGDGMGVINVRIPGRSELTFGQCIARDCGYNISSYDVTGSVEVTAVPASGSRFDGWEAASPASCSDRPTCSLSAGSFPASLTANFAACSRGSFCPAAVVQTATLQNPRDIWAVSEQEAWVVAAPASDVSGTPSNPTLWRWDGQLLSPDHPPTRADLPLLAIAGSSPTAAWAVGERGTVLYWNGQTWTAEPLPTLKTLRGVRAESQTVWAVGDSGTALRRSGGVWTFTDSTTNADLYGVFSIGDSAAWTVGRQGTILHFNGTAWTKFASGTTQDLHGVWGTAENDLWAVGGAGTLLHWDGTQWKSFASGVTTDLLGIRQTGPSAAVVFGSSGTLLRWDGTDWKPDPSLAPVYGAVYSIWPSTSGESLAVTDGGLLRFLR